MFTLIKLITIQIILITIYSCQGITASSLSKLNINQPKGKYKIEATIINKVNNETYKTIEFLNCLDSMSSYGKIIIHQNHQTISLYHNQFDDNKRLVLTQYNYCYYMDRKLVSLIVDGGNLLNSILITGPSIILRLKDDSLNWTSGSNTTTINKWTITDENKLNITTIYGKKSPAVNQPDSDFIVPHEIILSGTVDGPEYGLTDLPSDELIVINSISLTKLNPESYHDIEFKPPIGLGCPSLVEETKLFPQLFNSQQLSFKSIEISSKPNEEQNNKINIEIYANWDKIITIINPIINDQNVNHNQSTCSVSTINSDDYLNQVNQLFWIKDDLKYRGQFPSFQGELETWESTNYEETINGIKYDRVNIIHMLQKVNSTINLTNYILINSTRTIYNEVYLGQYDLIESQTRQVLKFDTITTINQTMEQLTVNCKH